MRILPIAFAIVSILACRKDTPPTAEPAASAGGPQAAAGTVQPGAPRPAPAGQGGEAGAMGRVPSSCPDGKLVSGGDTSTPEGTLYLAYKAALKGDAGGGFDEFYALFLPEKNREDIKRSIWANLLKYVSRYTTAPDDPAFTACRHVATGADRMKIFVKCNDPQKSDPPVVLERGSDGVWRIDVMTP
ncbi:MAG: hypothetical protein FJ087_03830 [Deltaproteobacteria bacterium]|nr:hypothetical protein [Deltaproteobacteria bacterium]